MEASITRDCHYPYSDKCKICRNETDCNIKRTFQQCIQCDSRTNSACLGNDTKTWAICDNYLSSCVTGVTAHGDTQRRCSKGYEEDNNDFPNKRSAVCIENKCNHEIFPPNRLQCHQCGSDSNADCDFIKNPAEPLALNSSQSDSDLLKPCNMFSIYDQCYAFLSKGEKLTVCCLIVFMQLMQSYFQFLQIIVYTVDASLIHPMKGCCAIGKRRNTLALRVKSRDAMMHRKLGQQNYLVYNVVDHANVRLDLKKIRQLFVKRMSDWVRTNRATFTIEKV